MKRLKSIGKLTLCLLLCLSVGYIGSVFVQTSLSDWYLGLKQAIGAPPPAVFTAVWTILYLMMGVSLWWVSHANPPKQAYALFYLQLFFNLLWPFLLFGMQNILLGLVDLLLLDVCLMATICTFWKPSRVASLLLMPYFAWTLYATYLNFTLLFLN